MADPITGVVSGSAPANSAGLYTNQVARDPKQTMDSEVFMHLLVTQLRNQDPSSPMDTNQMIAQTTQLAQMEKMTEMAQTSTEDFSLQMRIAAAAYVGKQVTYTGKDGKVVTGLADSVSFAGAVPTVSVGGVDVPLDLISGVTTASASPTPSA
ncbi:flagellar hook assembly protein FlgD [Lacisediminihabitans changchengi]|uniref:Flagellar hook capping protein n=1 Tax=Lacisediminihabitans changchengi TaxID=2787634 RepID=A0A934STJ4_9MICO|nr:flagellar hook capping FlgD N-terminal domain-containing protein [Lacisediminihabitans changchengi]MBK4348680.1 flagellar hook capping protein [Lacisediminihabitans changchengi]